MADYDVTIVATVTKTIRVEDVESEDDAVEFAHSVFTTACQDEEKEKYTEDMVNCVEVIHA